MMWITFAVSPCQRSFDICAPILYCPLTLFRYCYCFVVVVVCLLSPTNIVVLICHSLKMLVHDFFLYTFLQLTFLETAVTKLFKLPKSLTPQVLGPFAHCGLFLGPVSTANSHGQIIFLFIKSTHHFKTSTTSACSPVLL